MAFVAGVKAYGGYGQAANGRCQYGTPESVISPTFYTSLPSDGAINVALDQWIEFYTYYYSSVPAIYGPEESEVIIEISEDAGATFSPADQAPYDLVFRPYDGQQYWCKIVKTSGLWPQNSEIIIRYTGVDEHGNVAVKEEPVVWG